MPHIICRPAFAVILFLLAGSIGCGSGDGLSDYDRQKKGQEDAAGGLKSKGAKLKEMHYPQGDAWSVNLSGATVSTETFDQLKKLGRVSELDLSKSTVTDAMLARVNEVEIGSVILKLDLSDTSITDAGLDKLENLMVLTDLNLKGTKVTAAGVERFKKKRKDNPKIMQMFKSPNVRLN